MKHAYTSYVHDSLKPELIYISLLLLLFRFSWFLKISSTENILSLKHTNIHNERVP